MQIKQILHVKPINALAMVPYEGRLLKVVTSRPNSLRQDLRLPKASKSTPVHHELTASKSLG